MSAANSVKGEVSFNAGGQIFRLAFTANALIALEERMDKSVGEIGDMFESGLRLSHLRVLLWAALSEHHNIPELEAGELMDVIGIDEVGELVGRAFMLAFPEEDDATGSGHPQNPAVKKTAGTGQKSIKSGRRPA